MTKRVAVVHPNGQLTVFSERRLRQHPGEPWELADELGECMPGDIAGPERPRVVVVEVVVGAELPAAPPPTARDRERYAREEAQFLSRRQRSAE